MTGNIRRWVGGLAGWLQGPGWGERRRHLFWSLPAPTVWDSGTLLHPTPTEDLGKD